MVERPDISRARARIEGEGLQIVVVNETTWRVSAADGSAKINYFPIEDRWLMGKRWGRGTITLIEALKGEKSS
jgi:hypothetical protein